MINLVLKKNEMKLEKKGFEVNELKRGNCVQISLRFETIKKLCNRKELNRFYCKHNKRSNINYERGHSSLIHCSR